MNRRPLKHFLVWVEAAKF